MRNNCYSNEFRTIHLFVIRQSIQMLKLHFLELSKDREMKCREDFDEGIRRLQLFYGQLERDIEED